ncbi:AarF/ABC1/UbiB kinase family protein [Nocardia sp. NPDC005978]|uniref:ABC1 kinase family protein n=1 Tax=unclassified Nocardia TaxID=2637762 RepID=UPI0033AFD8CF
MPEPRQGGFRRLRRRADSDTAGQPPTRASVRNAKIVSLPVAYAARRAGGVGRRALGRPAHEVELDIQARTAQHMFEVLGELKGCAAKLGQLLALYELALPAELGAPYREALSHLQDSAPAMLPGAVRAAMAENLGPEWESHFTRFDARACAAASVGQVHRAVWHDGRAVAVKLMYPGARESVRSDLEQIRRLAPLATVFAPAADTRALAAALADCINEELDYVTEAATQRSFATAYADDPDFVVPEVVHQQGDVLVSEWLDGIPLPRIIESGAQQEKDRIGLLITRFVLSSGVRTGRLYTDPHPGNFRVLRDGRLGVVDFGACPTFPADFPALVGEIADAAFNGTDAQLLAVLRRHEFVRSDRDFDIAALRIVTTEVRELFYHRVVRLTTPWLRRQVLRATDLRLSNVCRELTSAPQYTPIGRAIVATAGVLCQLDVEGPLRAELLTYIPELAAPLERFLLGEELPPVTRHLVAVTDASSSATPSTTVPSVPCTSKW